MIDNPNKDIETLKDSSYIIDFTVSDELGHSNKIKIHS